MGREGFTQTVVQVREALPAYMGAIVPAGGAPHAHLLVLVQFQKRHRAYWMVLVQLQLETPSILSWFFHRDVLHIQKQLQVLLGQVIGIWEGLLVAGTELFLGYDHLAVGKAVDTQFISKLHSQLGHPIVVRDQAKVYSTLLH